MVRAGWVVAIFALGLLCGLGIGRGRPIAVQAQERRANFDADAVEMDRTRDLLVRRVHGIHETLKGIARDVTLQTLEDPDGKREKQIQAEIAPLLEDAQVLFVQTFLLALDNVVDQGGGPAEGFVLGLLSQRLGVPIHELVERREKSSLGLGGVALGYAIARAAKVSPDEIFANKADNRSWPELMRHRQVTLAQLQAVLEANEKR